MLNFTHSTKEMVRIPKKLLGFSFTPIFSKNLMIELLNRLIGTNSQFFVQEVH